LNPTTLLVFDALLLISIVCLAWESLASSDMRRGVILFMAFGLLLAVAWSRLQAPDVALAEAAIGAGLSGALLLSAVGRKRAGVSSTGGTAARNHEKTRLQLTLKWIVALLIAALTITLGWAYLNALSLGPHDGLPRAITENLEASGVSNPVTAVLLNFRAWDTLLELAVLLTAALGILALGNESPAYRPAGVVYEGLIRWLVPLLILTAGYLLWVGAHAPGGAFQAGATLAAAGVVLRLAGRHRIGLPAGIRLRLLMAAGVGVFLLVGLALLLAGRPFLGYPPALAGVLILVIETAAMLAIAATLVLAFVGGRQQTDVHSSTAGKPEDPTASGPGPARPARAGGAINDLKPEQKAC
jgi:multisubunit Na+/H+ antiporter MnhB subunit